MQVRYRRAKPQDVEQLRGLLEPDRPLFTADTWRILPDLLHDLVMRERILLCVLERIDTGRIVFVGGSGFLRHDFLTSAIEGDEGLLGPAFSAESRGRMAFLNRKSVAEGNRRGDLSLLNFFGVPPVDLSDATTLENLGNMTDAWNFFHKGFQLREIWCDFTVPYMCEFMVRMGLLVFRERILAGSATAKLLLMTRDRALQLTPSWPASALITSRPRFGFSKAEQQLLELALLDHSDRAAEEALDLCADAIKKRWRSIYAKVSRTEPALLRSDLSGADRRRALLQNLRQNLQELRPH